MDEGEHKIEAHSSLFIAHGKDEKIKLILVSKKERGKSRKRNLEEDKSVGGGIVLYL